MNQFAFVKYHKQNNSSLYLQKWLFSKMKANFVIAILLRSDFVNYKLK